MKPNVLVIFADQMRGDTMGCAGNPVVQTPNLDRLAQDGVRFSNACTPDPICVPARATFTTGNYPHRCTGNKNNGGRIRDDQIKIAELFSGHGYVSYASGKLHYVPYSPPGEARLVHGFDRVALHESGRIIKLFNPEGDQEGLEDYHDYLRDVGWDGYARAHGVGNNDIHPAPSPVPAEHYCDAWVCTQAIDFLREHHEQQAGKPFFMFMSFPKPHAPYDPPRPYDSMYDPRDVPVPYKEAESGPLRTPTKHAEKITHGWDLWSPQTYQVARAHYYGQVTFQDAQIGRMLDYLEEQGALDNTIVVYTADHGDLMGDFGFFAKSCFYQGSVHIPFIVHWPRALRRGVVSDRLVGLQDLLPTLASLAGISLPDAVDGMDLSGYLQGDDDAPERDVFVAYCQGSPRQLYMVRDKRWKYLYSEMGGLEELYDLQDDPDELLNIAGRADAEPVLAAMRQRMVDWAQENGDDELLADGVPAVNRSESLDEVEFRPGTLGWRWH
jgi:choline-sulfatase